MTIVHPADMGPVDRQQIVIGILTWNGYELARACLESLTRLNGWPIPVVVVDNGSREPEGERLAREFGSPVEAVKLPENRLPAGGYNAVIRWAAKRGASHILVLNNDTLVTDPAMLDRLVAAAGPGVAAAGPLVLNSDGSLFSAGGKLGAWTGRTDHVQRHQMPAQDRPYKVPWIDGPCMLISIEAACKIGGLDPAFVSTWEELDWCARARAVGYESVVEPRTTIRHNRGRTISSRQREMYLLRNSILFTRRQAGWPRTVTAVLSFVFLTVPEQILRSLPSLSGTAVVVGNAWAAVRWNVMDAIRRRAWHQPASGPAVCGDVLSN